MLVSAIRFFHNHPMFYLLFRRVHRSFIVLIFATGIIGGTVLSSVFGWWLFASPVWLGVALLLLVINFYFPRFVIFSLAALAGIILGSFRTNQMLGDYQYIHQFAGQTVTVTGVIYEDPEVDSAKSSVRINQLSFGDQPDQQISAAGSIFIIFSRGNQELERSSRIVIQGQLAEGFGSFAGSFYNPSIRSISKPDPPDLALQFRDSFGGRIKQFIPEPEVDLSLGYLLGQRRALPKDLLNVLQIVGLTHIIVASGYNLSVLVRATRRIFRKISRFAALLFGFLLVICFISITGFTPSMARAGFVAIMALVAWFFGRQFHPVKLLTMVASITLLLNPAYIQDLGWLLSFAAFVGVMVVSPLLTAYFYGQKSSANPPNPPRKSRIQNPLFRKFFKIDQKSPTSKPNFFAQIMIETTAAQLCCLPLLLYYFGSFSIVSLVANMLILPTIPIVMLLTFIIGIFAFLPFLAAFISWFASFLLSAHIVIAQYLGSLNWAIVSVSLNNPFIFLLYIPIIVGAIYMQRHTKYRLINSNVVE